ncbi:MAG: hypothetical protein IJH67_06480 [Thermoguttaceae bacterium]|nr:hypothetical protein [Thermoguttaceae bacterium]
MLKIESRERLEGRRPRRPLASSPANGNKDLETISVKPGSRACRPPKNF